MTFRRPAPFRLQAPDPLELDIHEVCASSLDRLLAPPAMWACYPAGAVELTAAQHARYARMGLKRGMPDILFSTAGCGGSRSSAGAAGCQKTRIVRTRRGSPRVLIGQEETLSALIASGGFRDIAIITSVDEMLAQLTAWGIPLRGRIAA
jgi:hypothetical protein